MSTQFAVPEVGKKIRITVRTKETLAFAEKEWRDTVYEGEVLKPYAWLNDTQFCLTGNADWPVRVVPVEWITEMVYLDGTEAKMINVSNEVITKQFEGSGGSIYTATKVGTKVTCTCPGFRFRGKCRHTAQL